MSITFGMILGIGALVGATVKGIQGLIDRHNAKKQLELEREQTQEELQLSLDQAEAALEAQLGQLADFNSYWDKIPEGLRQRLIDAGYEMPEYYESYDEWYEAQRLEWEADAQGMSFEEYIRDQQLEELGEYGVQRAKMEAQADIARQNIEIARDELELQRQNIARQYGFAEDQYDAGLTQSQRVTRGEGAAVAAMGIRGGTAAATVAENQRVRVEQLDLFLEKAQWARDLATSYTNTAEQKLDLASSEIDQMLEIDLTSLNNSMINLRTQYDFNVEALRMGAEHGLETLELAFKQQFNPIQATMNIVGGALEGAQMAFSLYSAGAGQGAWGFDETGQFWLSDNLFPRFAGM
jgi:hypothetical protein